LNEVQRPANRLRELPGTASTRRLTPPVRRLAGGRLSSTSATPPLPPGDARMRRLAWVGIVGLLLAPAGRAEAPRAALTDYFPPPESQGGWRSLLPKTGEPGAEEKAAIRDKAGVDWDKLKEAWEHNAAVERASGLLVIRKGYVVGEWYKDGD